MKRSHQEFPEKGNPIFELVEELWKKGCFDDYSEKHFLMKCLSNEDIDFYGKDQLINNESQSFGYSIFKKKDSEKIFLMNFAAKLMFFKNKFGEKNTVNFVKNQLAAGKKNYDENQFFRSLSEFEVLNYFSAHQYYHEIKELIYEPKLGVNGANPEVRILYENDIIVDIEVKTPGFKEEDYGKDKIITTVLLNDEGKKKTEIFARENNINIGYPRVKKAIDYLNSAAKKFEVPKTNRHLNLLVINWSYSDFESNSYLEALGFFYNDLTGILRYKNIGLKLGVNPNVFDKLSGIIIYSSTAESFTLNNLRYAMETKKYSMIPLNTDVKLLEEVTLLKAIAKERKEGIPRCLVNFKKNKIEGTKLGYHYMKLSEKYKYTL